MVTQNSNITKEEKAIKTKEEKSSSKEKYFEAVGRRKESVARVRINQAQPGISINNKTLEQYFPLLSYQSKILSPLKEANLENKFFISVKVQGGGLTGQAEAIRLGISRSLVKFNEKLQSLLRNKGFLTRDSRAVERKKYGLKKARRAPQWQKR
ncbi:MAG: 30S ribosomal protein S9 [Minisyncoccia bacterium]